VHLYKGLGDEEARRTRRPPKKSPLDPDDPATWTPLVSAGQLLVSFAVLAVLSRLFTGSWPNRARWLWTPAVSLLISAYEPLTDTAFSMLHCVQATSFSVLAGAPAFDCTSLRHSYYAGIATAVVIVVTTLFPLAVVVTLAVLRKRLHDPAVRSHIGLLYGEYRPALRFWLLVSLLRRTLLVGVQLLPGAQLSSLVSVLVVAAFFIAHRWLHPLEHTTGNLLQEIAFFSLLLVAAGKVFVSATLGLAELQSMTLGVQYFLAALVLATLLLMLVITLWDARHAVYSAWVIARSAVQLAQLRGRQWSQKRSIESVSSRPAASLTELLIHPPLPSSLNAEVKQDITLYGEFRDGVGDDRL
jgi:hypothetical protein